MKPTFINISGQPLSTLAVAALVIAAPGILRATQLGVGLYDTGVDNVGNVLPVHSTDQHYIASGASSVSSVEPRYMMWVYPGAGSAWIGPNTTDDAGMTYPGGYYDYSLTFNLGSLDPASVRVSGRWASDNSAQLFLNGQDTGIVLPDEASFSALHAFVVDHGFVQGSNVLDFRVFNYTTYVWGNPTGLVVSGLTLTTVPEPSLLALAAVAGSLVVARRRSRS